MICFLPFQYQFQQRQRYRLPVVAHPLMRVENPVFALGEGPPRPDMVHAVRRRRGDEQGFHATDSSQLNPL